MKTISKATRRRGFSLLEMIVVIGILSLVMAVVFTQINLVQKRYRTEEMKLDLTQESREFMDQIVRDLHSVGYPTQKMFNPTGVTPALANPPNIDTRIAAGLVKAAYDELWFEGDVNGDGTVWVIDYKLQADANGNCPCRISRSQVAKQSVANGSTPVAQSAYISYSMELTDVINSGGAGGNATGAAKYTITGSSSVVGGTTQTNDSMFTAYKPANLFTYYDADGNVVTPADIGSPGGATTVAKIKVIRINLNVLARQGDLQTGVRPVMSYSAAVRMPNQ
jgi:prepilin-type N-terminal cleavage/methylation domain-containing protein